VRSSGCKSSVAVTAECVAAARKSERQLTAESAECCPNPGVASKVPVYMSTCIIFYVYVYFMFIFIFYVRKRNTANDYVKFT